MAVPPTDPPGCLRPLPTGWAPAGHGGRAGPALRCLLWWVSCPSSRPEQCISGGREILLRRDVCKAGEVLAEVTPSAGSACPGCLQDRFQCWSASAEALAARSREPLQLACSSGQVVLCPVPKLAAVAEGVFPSVNKSISPTFVNFPSSTLNIHLQAHSL